MLSRRWLINCALVLVIIVLIWAGVSVDDERADTTEAGLSNLRPADVNRIEITSAALSLALERDAQGWHIRQPVQWPAYTDNVQRLLSILSQRATPIADATSVDLAALGLQPPVATLRLNDTRLAFGTSNTIGERRYLWLDTSIYLLPDVHLAFATQGLAGMIERRLLPQSGAIERLRLPKVEIVRDSGGDYLVAERPEIEPERLKQLIVNWQTLPAVGIRAFNMDAHPGELITATFADGVEYDFLLLSSEPEIIIANPTIGMQYHFRGDYRDQLIDIDADG